MDGQDALACHRGTGRPRPALTMTVIPLPRLVGHAPEGERLAWIARSTASTHQRWVYSWVAPVARPPGFRSDERSRSDLPSPLAAAPPRLASNRGHPGQRGDASFESGYTRRERDGIRREGSEGREGTVEAAIGRADWVRFARGGLEGQGGGCGAGSRAWPGSSDGVAGGGAVARDGRRAAIGRIKEGLGTDRGFVGSALGTVGGQIRSGTEDRRGVTPLRNVGPRRLGRVGRGG